LTNTQTETGNTEHTYSSEDNKWTWFITETRKLKNSLLVLSSVLFSLLWSLIVK